MSGIVVVSLLFAGRRGLVWRWLRDWRNGRRLRLQAVLLDLYALATQHDDPTHPHTERVLNVMSDVRGRSRHNLEALANLGLINQHDQGRWALTEKGRDYAKTLLRERGAVAGMRQTGDAETVSK